MLEKTLQLEIKKAFLASLPEGRLHFAAHSHHPWPEATRKAQMQYWDDSARLLDSKWDSIFEDVLAESKRNLAELLGLTQPQQIVEGTNTFELVARLLSSLDFRKPIRILTTQSEFYSFTRLAQRLSEFDNIQIDSISTQPFETFVDRFTSASKENKYDFIFVSQVFFDSGFYPTRILEELKKCPAPVRVVDLYHAAGAVPLKLQPYADDLFFVGGGYKYLSAGEGACFLVAPQNSNLRPWQTGWFADFSSLENEKYNSVQYAPGAARFAGATFDPTGWYRFNAVRAWQKQLGLTVELVHQHVRDLQDYFVQRLQNSNLRLAKSNIIGFCEAQDWGHFLCIETRDPQKIVKTLRSKDVFIDARKSFLRFGFGYYQTKEDIDRLIQVLKDEIL